jgi:S-adenosylmethionine synthetase
VGPWAGARRVEIVERKGLGHPDTICDMLSEQLSVALCRRYLDEFGLVLHHNVDKALLVAGSAEPDFRGGRLLEPIDIYLSGRATTNVRGKTIPVGAIAEEVGKAWLRQNMHALAPEADVRLHCLVRPSSPDLVELFMRQRDEGILLANDTSCGVGFAPLTELERVVLAVEKGLNAPAFKARLPATGEDVKVMGVREHHRITLTVSCALIGRFLEDIEAYRDTKDRLRCATSEIVGRLTDKEAQVHVNVADDIANSSVYLTVTGTSAEAGDDGQTGRGNRANGLITPGRPMTLEALAGKNPITHVGKLYNAAAMRIAAAIVAEIPDVTEAECYLASQVGTPIDRPHMTYLRVSREGVLGSKAEDEIRAVCEREIASIPLLWKSFLTQSLAVA